MVVELRILSREFRDEFTIQYLQELSYQLDDQQAVERARCGVM
ncbi:hypothetical protein [Bacillus mycoides]|nr:hypothetical protein [Bacillus mycoides]